MPRRTRSLFRRIEKALETIARGSTPLETIRDTAQFLVDNFSEDLGIQGGRIYARQDEAYELVETFGTVSRAPIGLCVDRHYSGMEILLDEGSVVMALSDSGLDRRLEEALGTQEHFAAIAVADGAYVLSFDVATKPEDPDDLLATLNIVRLAVNQKLREERMLEILEEARRIQTSILPRRIPEYGDFELAARSIPAEIVGGDFYDFITLTDTAFNVVVADATGHGLPAALQVRDVFTGLRMGLTRDYKLTRTIERLNAIIHRSRLATKFVSIFLAELEVGGTVLYVNAGHPPGILVRADGSLEFLRSGGMIVGPRLDAHYTLDIVRMEPGDLLALYTDGLTEATDPQTGEEFSVSRLSRLLSEGRATPIHTLTDRLFQEVHDLSQREVPEDDQTLVLVRRRARDEEPS
ncbi:MAG: PP2C family protein-serine/threonine phosphatase [Acidobacteria bacterium]|nr:PP2C family protein-serine/threonine phosphatase [Acidobacteriota bacterium]